MNWQTSCAISLCPTPTSRCSVVSLHGENAPLLGPAFVFISKEAMDFYPSVGRIHSGADALGQRAVTVLMRV